MRELLVIRKITAEIPQCDPDKSAAGHREYHSTNKQEAEQFNHSFSVRSCSHIGVLLDHLPLKIRAARPSYAPSKGPCQAGFVVSRIPPQRAGATRAVVGGDETVVAGGVHLYIEDGEKPPFANRAPGSVGQCDAILQGRQHGCRSAGSLRRVKRTLGTRSRSRHLACQFSTRCSMEQPQAPAASLHRESRRRSIFARPRRRTSELC